MGRFETQRRVHSVEVADSSAQCKVWKKVRIGSPEGIGIPIAITDCDELTPENVGRLCEGEVYDYCENNAAQSAETQADGMCIREAVDEFSTCELEHTPKKEQKPTQESNQQQKEEL